MKKFAHTFTGLACVACLILACAERPDGSCCIGWTLGFLVLSFIFGYAYCRITSDLYPDV